MIEINYAGRFGNNLIQIFVATIFSDKINNSINNVIDNQIIKRLKCETFNFENTIEINNNNFFSYYKKNNLEVNLYLNDYFQTKEIILLFDEKRHLINGIDYQKNNDVFVHVRLGDLLQSHSGIGNRYLGFEYYDNILSNINFDNGYISTDSPKHEIIKKLMFKYNLNLYSGTPEETILFASSFEHKVLSLGTFSWWIGFLNNQNNIYYPNPKNHPIWHGDIFVFDKWNKI